MLTQRPQRARSGARKVSCEIAPIKADSANEGGQYFSVRIWNRSHAPVTVKSIEWEATEVETLPPIRVRTLGKWELWRRDPKRTTITLSSLGDLSGEDQLPIDVLPLSGRTVYGVARGIGSHASFRARLHLVEGDPIWSSPQSFARTTSGWFGALHHRLTEWRPPRQISFRFVMVTSLALGLAALIFGVLGDTQGWWLQRPFYVNIVSGISGAGFSIPILGWLLRRVQEQSRRRRLYPAIVAKASVAMHSVAGLLKHWERVAFPPAQTLVNAYRLTDIIDDFSREHSKTATDANAVDRGEADPASYLIAEKADSIKSDVDNDVTINLLERVHLDLLDLAATIDDPEFMEAVGRAEISGRRHFLTRVRDLHDHWNEDAKLVAIYFYTVTHVASAYRDVVGLSEDITRQS